MYGMLQTAFRPSCINRASVFEWHKGFKEGRESARDDERCGRSKEANTPELIGQRLGLRLLCWLFKGVQEEIPSEEASILQIGSVAFPPGQSTSPQLHPCHGLFDQYGRQDSSSASLLVRPCSPWLWVFPKLKENLRGCRYETIEAVTKVIDTLTQEDFYMAYQKLLERCKCIAAGGDYLEGD